jgi:hypothetical protein
METARCRATAFPPGCRATRYRFKDEAVGKTPGEPAGSLLLRVGSEIGHLMPRGMSVRPDAVAPSRPDTQLCERRAAFRRRLFPTASDGSGSAGSELLVHRQAARRVLGCLPCHAAPTTTRALGGAMATGVPRMETQEQSRAAALVPVVLVPQVDRGTRRVYGRITIRLQEEAAWTRSASLANGSLF